MQASQIARKIAQHAVNGLIENRTNPGPPLEVLVPIRAPPLGSIRRPF